MTKMLAAVLLVSCALFVYDSNRPVQKVAVNVTVNAGSTLWDLVGDAMQEVGDQRDIREVIYHTRKLNGIVNLGRLYVGQKITIPCEVKR